MDPQIQEEIYDMQTVEITLTYQHEEIEKLLLEAPIFDPTMDIESWMGYLLLGPSYNDEDVPFIGQDDDRMCQNISISDPSMQMIVVGLVHRRIQLLTLDIR
jgi:hypothetical protein